MNFFRTYYDQEDQVVDVFKEIDFGDIIETDLYELYEPLDTDNLMTIAYQFYRNVDDAWVIYFFNKISDATFGIIPKYVVDKTVNMYMDKIIDYDTLSFSEKQLAQELVREYYMQEMSFDEAVVKSLEVLASPILRASSNFTNSFSGYLYEQILIREKISTPLKIPIMSVVLKMKAYMNRYSIAWKAN